MKPPLQKTKEPTINSIFYRDLPTDLMPPNFIYSGNWPVKSDDTRLYDASLLEIGPFLDLFSYNGILSQSIYCLFSPFSCQQLIAYCLLEQFVDVFKQQGFPFHLLRDEKWEYALSKLESSSNE